MAEDPKTSTSLGFRYVERSACVEISRDGRRVAVLTGVRGERFLRRVASADAVGQQLEMAKATGQYKFGNERLARKRRTDRHR